MTLVSAPGKLFIAGEYAILDRGTALVAAAGVRAKVRAERTASSSFSFSHPVSGEVFYFDLDRDGGLQWSSENPGHWGDVLVAVFSTWGNEHDVSTLPPLSISIDTEAFYSNFGGERCKLGFGSSAAAIAALSQALMTEAGNSKDKSHLSRFCLDAHSRLQSGRGSGADVLASLTGGVIAATAGKEKCESMSWPTGLHVLAVWSGVEASSAALVGRFEAYRQDRKMEYSSHMNKLRDASARAVSAWQVGDVPLILSTLRDCDAALLNLDSDSQIGIHTEIHGRLRAIAETEGAVYKVSGGGGGDFGLVFSQSLEIMMRARDALEASGFKIFDVGVAESGVRVEGD